MLPTEPMTELAAAIEQARQGKTIAELAREWGVPRWVLDDVRHNRIKMPGAVYLIAIAKGLGKTVEQVAQETPQRTDGATIASGKTSPTTS